MTEKSPIVLYVQGMHCAACEFYLEDRLSTIVGLSNLKADLSRATVTFECNRSEQGDELACELTKLVIDRGYTLSFEPTSKPTAWHEFKLAIPVALAVMVGFILLQRVGLVNLINSDAMSYGTAVVIGLVASVSSCLAVVGGLVLSLGASSAKAGGTWSSQAMFHVGRLVSFFVLGGALGIAGKFFELGLVGNLVLSVVVAIVMLLLGLNLLDSFPSLRRLQLQLPKGLAQRATSLSGSTHWLAPFLVGTLTFFLPCGFTQSMQIYTLTTGSFWVGGATMLAFALGTLPMLALLSFGSFEFANKPWKGTFFKAAGLVVIAMALINLWSSLAVLGLVPPLSFL